MRSDKKVTLRGDIVHETENAILVLVDEKEYWFPLSAVHEIHRTEKRLVVDAWVAEKRGLL